MALAISKIPFLGPVSAVEVARVDGEWILNPLYSQTLESDVRITVAGTKEGINMVEGCTSEISEDDLVEVFFKAHAQIKEQIAWQEEIQAQVGIPKEPIVDPINWTEWTEKFNSFLTEERVKLTFVSDKVKRGKALDDLLEEFKEEHKAQIEELAIPSKIFEYIFDDVLKKKITELIFKLGQRVDGRSFEQVRMISTEVGLLPFTHGSAVFTRGRTQALFQ